MDFNELKNTLEALLATAEQPLSLAQLSNLLEQALLSEEHSVNAQIEAALGALEQDYQHRGLELVKVASGYRLQAREAHAQWIGRLRQSKPPRYSRAVLETLSLIAYRQPITRAEIEQVRGVSVSGHIIRSLLEREWIAIVGQREAPGRPALFGTTKAFLDYFGLSRLSDLPDLPELRSLVELANNASGAATVPVSESNHDPEQSPEPEPESQAAEPLADPVLH